MNETTFIMVQYIVWGIIYGVLFSAALPIFIRAAKDLSEMIKEVYHDCIRRRNAGNGL